MRIAQPGETCQRDPRIKKKIVVQTYPSHAIVGPDEDAELGSVYQWLAARPDLSDALTDACDAAIKYVLDGARTFRFDISGDDVDRDERASVGTKLQYHLIEALNLRKVGPLDTEIANVPVELKASVSNSTPSWMIPSEGQCQVTLLSQIDPKRMRHRHLLFRAHRAWLNEGNKDSKRTIAADAYKTYALTVLDWTPLPPEPLQHLTLVEKEAVFGEGGLVKRLTALFGYLPDTVIPRGSILTVGANLADPLRRAREAKVRIRDAHGLEVLVGKWVADRERAAEVGFDLTREDWVAVSPSRGGDPKRIDFSITDDVEDESSLGEWGQGALDL